MEGIITIAGCMPRIGTTTQAMGLARYIQECSDYKVAYVECNAQNYIWSASELYRSTKNDRSGGHMNIEGINMYNSSRIGELTVGGTDIDFLICDCGDINSREFDETRFLTGNARILVGGVKPNELHYTEKALRIKEYADSIFIFSFVPGEDREELKESMGSHAEDTFFSPFMPDPFMHLTKETAEGYYEKLMPHIIKKIKV